jgi:hypothetical protein
MAVTQLRNQQSKNSRESTPSGSTPQRLEQEPQHVRVKAEEVERESSVAGVLEPLLGIGADNSQEATTSTGSPTALPGQAVKEESPGVQGSAIVPQTAAAAAASLTEPAQVDSGSETDEGGLVVTSLLRGEARQQAPEPLVSSLGKRKADGQPDETGGIEVQRIKAETD